MWEEAEEEDCSPKIENIREQTGQVIVEDPEEGRREEFLWGSIGLERGL